MESIVSSSFFLGASTPSGFHSLFSELYDPHDGWRLFILKGGPGTGKSTIMKKVSAECEKRGYYCERIYCSSDPKSLDGVIIPALKVSVADGTAPHVLEPKYPGVAEITVDLGQFRDDKLLGESREEIIRVTQENSLRHKKCTDFLAASKSADNDTASVVLPALRLERLYKFSEKLALKKLKGASDVRGRQQKRFLSALTPEGLVLFRETFSAFSTEKIVLSDSFGFASSVLLKIISMKATEMGLDSIICHCPMSPEFKPEHLIIPSLGIGFYTSNRWHPDDFTDAYNINCLSFYDTSTLSKHKNRIAFNRRSRDELLAEAVNKLTEAKKLHDVLESYYIKAMDFESLQEYSEEIVKKVIS